MFMKTVGLSIMSERQQREKMYEGEVQKREEIIAAEKEARALALR